jgi:pre-mRNA-splicing factor ISY1
MARSQEKAMSMLNRWVDQKRGIESGGLNEQRHPRIPSECRSIREGEISRSQILRELGSSISQIQNASIGEARIRELNDMINRLLRSKYAWEVQIRQLGGPDYTKVGASISETDGIELPGQGGYKYFGAAKSLPGVRELLEDDAVSRQDPRKSRKQLLKHIEPSYYGWRDEDDPELIQEESILQDAAREHVQDYSEPFDEEESQRQTDDTKDIANITYVHDSREIEQLIMNKRKDLLISRYIDADMVESYP